MELCLYQCPFPICLCGGHRDDLIFASFEVLTAVWLRIPNLLGYDTELLVRLPYVPFCPDVSSFFFFYLKNFCLDGFL